MRRTRDGFTIVELLVVIAIMGLLLALVLPALSGASRQARASESASNLRQIGTAITAYLNNWENHLPQMAWDVGGGEEKIIGALFGGKRGTLPFFGIDQVGSDRRPLNKYLQSKSQLGEYSSGKDVEVAVFESPLDIGGPIPGYQTVESFYETVGTSYILNDHCLSGEDFATLIPKGTPDQPGGRMPRIEDTTRTWVLGEHPIYNYQEGGDRGIRWYGDKNIVRSSLWFLDGHTASAVTVPVDDGNGGHAHTTKDYTFLPQPDWKCDNTNN